MVQPAHAPKRAPMSREIVLRAAVTLADDAGIDAVSMRNLARELGVVPMALYKHVTNKEELLDGMVDVIVAEIDPPTQGARWKDTIRQGILSARQVQLRHPWAPQMIKSRTHATPIVLDYMNSLIGTFRTGGFSADLTHQVMHALGSRMWASPRGRSCRLHAGRAGCRTTSCGPSAGGAPESGSAPCRRPV